MNVYMRFNPRVHSQKRAVSVCIVVCCVQKVMEELEASKFQHGEMKLAFYAQSPGEWRRLAQWVTDNDLVSDNVRWIIEIPRL